MYSHIRLVFVADGELEAKWLVSAGFPHLTKAFEEVSDILRGLGMHMF